MSFPCSVRLISSGSSASLSTSESFSMLFACRFKIFSFGYCSKTYEQRKTNLFNYCTLDKLWKLCLVLSILSIYNRVWHDKPISAKFKLCLVSEPYVHVMFFKLLQAQREVSSFVDCLKNYWICFFCHQPCLIIA